MNLKPFTRSLHYTFALFLVSAAFLDGTAALAQTRRRAASPAAKPSQPTPQRCAGGWSGVVKFTKTLKDSFESDEPGIRKSIDRIIHKTSRDYEYFAKAVVDGTDPRNALVSTNISLTDKDLKYGQEKVFDACNSREAGHWFIIESNDDRFTQASASGSARSFDLRVDEMSGNYNFSLAFPAAQGQFKREEHTRRSGHCQPKNNEPYDRSTDQAVTIPGESFSIQGRVDPDDPDTISGTKIWGDDGTGRVRTFIYQVSWTFTRCPGKLLITDLKFEHPDFPNFDKWEEIVEQNGTIDGNRVKVTAKVLNMSAEAKFATLKLKETYKGDKYNGARPDEMLPESDTSVRLEPGEERAIEYVWNTEGQSWFDDGRPHLLHRIKAELDENGQVKDAKEEPLNIAPKPVVLVHGLWSSAKAWIPLYQNLLTASHSYHWKAYPVGEKPEHGALNTGGSFLSSEKTNTLYENADQLERYIRYAQEDANAWHVDIVAHSMGGLISRLYIHRQMPDMADNAPQVKHLVMLGTPNAGSPCADVIDMKFTAFGERVQAIKDLKPENVAIFNQHVTNRRGTKFSALAGRTLPVMCKNVAWNDGVVSVESAHTGIEEKGFSNDLHTDLTDGKNFGQFVKPHLVTGPAKTYPIGVKNDPPPTEKLTNIDWGFYQAPTSIFDGIRDRFANTETGRQPRYYGAMADPQTAAGEEFAGEGKLGPNDKIETDLAVDEGPNLGITLIADPTVSVTLVDQDGRIRAKSLAGTREASGFFRTLFIAKKVTRSNWKLRLENTSPREHVYLVYSWNTGRAERLP